MANKFFMLVYQPKGDHFTHIAHYDNYADALNMFYITKKFHAEFKKPVRIELYDNRPKSTKAVAGDYTMHFDNREEA